MAVRLSSWLIVRKDCVGAVAMDVAVGLVESYLRLNGYFAVTEFQVQAPVTERLGRFETVTDLDILAVRLPWVVAETVLRHPRRPGELRCEIPMADDPTLGAARDMPDVLIGEVKEGTGDLNRGLLRTDVLFAALRRIGCCREEHIGRAVEALQRRGEFVTEASHGIVCRLRLASFAGHPGEPPTPAVLVVPLNHIVAFIEAHLRTYAEIWRSASFKDPVLALLKPLDKLEVRLVQDSRGGNV